MKFRSLQITTAILLIMVVFLTSAMTSNQLEKRSQPNVTIFPTPTSGWVTPDPLAIEFFGIFPSLFTCSVITPPYDGPQWEWISIGETTFEEFLDRLETIPLNITLRALGPNGWSIKFRDSDSIRQEWKICVNENRITTFSIKYYAAEREAYVWDAIANWGPPDAVSRTWHRTTRAYYWFERGIALTVYVWDEADHTAYGQITEVTYFPYVDADNYENVYPYNQTNIVLGGLPAIESIPIELDPLDYETILATVTPGAVTDIIGGK